MPGLQVVPANVLLSQGYYLKMVDVDASHIQALPTFPERKNKTEKGGMMFFDSECIGGTQIFWIYIVLTDELLCPNLLLIFNYSNIILPKPELAPQFIT